jgi:uncharacterized membrane protein
VLPLSDDTPLWLSHHWPHEHDRCVRIRGRWICRRCLVLYPTAFVAVLVAAHVALPPAWLLVVLPLPAVVDFVLEQLGTVRHSPARQVAVTLLLAVACGGLYVRYLRDHADGLVWGVGGAYLVLCLVAWLRGARSRQRG